jgi:hypothetical protein
MAGWKAWRGWTGAALGIAILASLGLAGCATQEAIQTERMLAAAGFQMKFADTPEKLAYLDTLQQRELFPAGHDGEVHFVYADAKSCKCLYVGTQRAYRRYERLAYRKELADERVEAAQLRSMDWGMWGPWGPWW